MEITHKITIADKLREILRVKKWNQKQLAGKFEVSEKTISFWINNKKRPSEANSVLINKLYKELIDKDSALSFKAQVQNFQARDGLDEIEKAFTVAEKNYYEAKSYVHTQEKTNNRYIFLFPSIGKEDDGWYKVGGRSLLFYKNILAPRLGREAKLREDTDKAHRFNNGIASVRWGNKLMAEAEELGYGAARTQYGIIVIDLNNSYDAVEIKAMVEVVKRERDKVKKIIRPKACIPSLMMAMNKLAQVLPSKVKKLDGAYREVFGKELLEPMAELLKIYFRFANGRMDKRDAKLEMLERTDDLTAMIHLMDESRMLDITARTRLGENVVEIREEIERNM